MTDSRHARSLRESLALRWDEERANAIADRVGKAYRRRRVARRVAGTTLALAVVVVAGAIVVNRPAPHAGQDVLADGSTIDKLTVDTTVTVIDEAPDAVQVRLERGRARFSVSRNPNRIFRVLAGGVSVTVLGTVFEVSRDGAHTRVAVSEGRVRVTRGELTMLLGPGEARDIDGAEAIPEPRAPDVEPETPAPEAPTPRAPQPAKSKAAVVTPTLNEVLREVDRLRLARDAVGAVDLLERALRRHPHAPETAHATFVLGRLQQEELSDPRAAARSFATVRALATSPSLAEDALAREVECLMASGDAAAARERAALYERTYPRGAHRERLNKLAPR